MTIPEALRLAATESFSSSAPLRERAASAQLGELAVLAGGDGALRRLVLVVQRDDETATAMIHLASTEIEAATDLDLKVGASDGPTPFDLMIEGELYGPVFVDQLTSAIGHLRDDQTLGVSTALITDGESLDGHTVGLPLGGPNDPRRIFKANELRELDSLVSVCREWLAGAPAPTAIFDPELLLPPAPGASVDEALDQFLELLDTLDEVHGGALVMTDDLAAMLDEELLLDEIFRWRDFVSYDALRCLLTKLGITDGSGPPAPESSPVHDDNRRTARVLSSILAAHAQAGSLTVDVHTVPRCWPASQQVHVTRTHNGQYCRGRARNLEVS